MSITRRTFLLSTFATALLASTLAGCNKPAPVKSLAPVDINAQTTCDLDGMMLADYPGPKAQIIYVNADAPVFFCDTVELFHTLLAPEQVRAITAVYVQDMGKADWDQPRGNWFDARSGLYVVESKRHGSMGPTIASFAQEADAKKFVSQWGGKLLRYTEVSIDMTDLSGGALHDTQM